MIRILIMFSCLVLASCGPTILDAMVPYVSVPRSSPLWGGYAPGDMIRLDETRVATDSGNLYRVTGNQDQHPYLRKGTLLTLDSVQTLRHPWGDPIYHLRLDLHADRYDISLDGLGSGHLFSPALMKAEGLTIIKSPRSSLR